MNVIEKEYKICTNEYLYQAITWNFLWFKVEKKCNKGNGLMNITFQYSQSPIFCTGSQKSGELKKKTFL